MLGKVHLQTDKKNLGTVIPETISLEFDIPNKNWVKDSKILNSLMPGGDKKVTHS